MILDVYVDLYFLINFSMDYICLYITAKILKIHTKASRFVIASIIGGLYSVASLFFFDNTLIAIFTDSLICIIMIAVCFFKKNESIKGIIISSLLYAGISMLLGGVMTAIFNTLNKLLCELDYESDEGNTTFIFAIIAVISALLSKKGISLISRKNSHKEYFVEITIGDKTASFLGFVDTGNLLKDSVSGKSVIFIDRSNAKEIIDISAEEKFYRGEILYKGSRLIPISTASGTSSILVFPAKKITLKEKSSSETPKFEVDCLVSLTDIKNNAISAIIPESITKINI